MTEAINQLELDIADMRYTIAYFEFRIAEKEKAIYELTQSMMAKQIITKDDVLKEASVHKIVRELVEKETEEIDYRILKAKCLNLHPELHSKITTQIWSVCNFLVSRGYKIKMPEKKQKEVNRVFNEKAIANGHTTEHVVVS